MGISKQVSLVALMAGLLGNAGVARADGTVECNVGIGPNSTECGIGSSASGDGGSAIGNGAVSSGGSTSSLGYQAKAIGDQSVSIGVFSQATTFGSTALGTLAQAKIGSFASALGQNAECSNYSNRMGTTSRGS